MAKLKTFTVTSINGDTTWTGEAVFNRLRVESISGSDGSVRLRYFRPHLRSMVRWDEYILNEDLSDVYDLLTEEDARAIQFNYYKDDIGFSGGTQTIYTNTDDIYLGIQHDDGWVYYVNRIDGVEKYYCDEDSIVVFKKDFVTDHVSGGTTTLFFRVASGSSITVYWGDGNSSTVNGAGASDVFAINEYGSSGPFDIQVSGDTDQITKLDLDDDGSFEGDISSLSEFTGLTHIDTLFTKATGDVSVFSALTEMVTLILNDDVSGNISSWSALTKAVTIIARNSDVTGDISSWSMPSLAAVWLNDTAVSGDVSLWSVNTSLEVVWLYDTNVSGDISTWVTLTSLSDMDVSGTDIDFDSDELWVGHDHDVDMSDCNLTTTQVDNALIAFAGGDFSRKTIDLDGNNQPRSSASDAALATLLAGNNTVNLTS